MSNFWAGNGAGVKNDKYEVWKFLDPPIKWLARYRLWVYNFENYFGGSQDHLTTALRRPKPNYNFFGQENEAPHTLPHPTGTIFALYQKILAICKRIRGAFTEMLAGKVLIF